MHPGDWDLQEMILQCSSWFSVIHFLPLLNYWLTYWHFCRNALPLECNDSSIFFADTPPLDQTPSTSQSSPASRNPLPLECNDDSSVFFADTQLLDQTPSASQSSPTSRIPATPIGLILSDDRYSCHSNICAGLTFSRIADLKRHHNTVHSTSPTRFWCAWKGCSRSDGGKPFPRKDKRDEHVRKKHLKTTNIRRHLWRLLLN